MSEPLRDDHYIQDWLVSLKILHRGHWNASRWYEQLNLGLGVGTAVCAAVSGTSAFAAFAAFAGTASAFMAGGLGLIAAISRRCRRRCVPRSLQHGTPALRERMVAQLSLALRGLGSMIDVRGVDCTEGAETGDRSVSIEFNDVH